MKLYWSQTTQNVGTLSDFGSTQVHQRDAASPLAADPGLLVGISFGSTVTSRENISPKEPSHCVGIDVHDCSIQPFTLSECHCDGTTSEYQTL